MSHSPVALQHSLLHVDCIACEVERVTAPREALAVMARVKFRDAWPAWLAGRRRIADQTRESYKQYFQPLDKYFGGMTLAEVNEVHVALYQAQRRVEIREWRSKHNYRDSDTAGASRINHEINALAQVLERAGLWQPLKRYYEPMQLPRQGPGIALTEDEERHLFAVARSRPRWIVAYCCDLISVSTTAGPGELRHLRVRNLELDGAEPMIHIEEGTKNVFRVRSLPLEGDAAWAVRALLERYQRAMDKFGIAQDPDHFVLFHRAHRRGSPPDPTRPMGSWKRAHYSLRAEAGKKFPRLLRVRRYDMRHTCATKMLEDPAISYSTIERMMGHKLGSRIKQRYDHVRDATLRRAAVTLDGGHTKTETRKPPESAQNQDGNYMNRKGL